ncbi:MAG: NAD(P)H-hydrate dehydratase [Rhodocyclaceae bacterium]|nr:NAD(P)H-hydrate dehydratase [Rhodocyclaceae bacterium]MBX3670019.1 NAD(P)H-hydrate dehydratase [Rhodocyclaceae bacterium]
MHDSSFTQLAPIYANAGIRRVEEHYLPGASPKLMDRAGAAASFEALRMLAGRGGRVLVACGPGNNGGDGFVVARQLRQSGFDVVAAFAADPARLSADAAQAYSAWRSTGGEIVSDLAAGTYALLIDAIFGIGLMRPVQGIYATWIKRMNAMGLPVLAIDVPSGLDSDTGRTLGVAVRAQHTATMIALKPGLLTLDGPDCCGSISVHELGLDCAAVAPPDAHVAGPAAYARHLNPRLRNTHKGSHGSVAIIGGAPGMLGAALLAARAALKIGAGRVYVGLQDTTGFPVDPAQPELMLRAALELLAQPQISVLAVGPGLGMSETAAALLRQALVLPLPLVLDADALNLIAGSRALADLAAARSAPTLFTPHPMEAARLLGCDTATVQAARPAATLEIARRYNARVVLKGCGSILALPGGSWLINTSGNPGMGAAGMGDVLTGMITGLLAQGWSADAALVGGVHLHGRAGDRLSTAGIGPNGMTAGELIDAARAEFNAAIAQHLRADSNA